MKKLILMLMLCPVFAIAQQKGVNFEQSLSWAEIQQKAKTENKFIFVDCFATWCGPCKLMDKEVYSSAAVGDFMNAHFISVKVQMDSTKADDKNIKAWYQDAKMIRSKYRVNAFPTYLLYSPDGKFVDNGVGALPETEFLKLVKLAADPERGYFAMLQKYRNGSKAPEAMFYLADHALILNDSEVSDLIANDLIVNYILKGTYSALYSRKVIQFITEHATKLDDPGFRWLYNHTKKADSVMKDPKYGEGHIEKTITIEVVMPEVKKFRKLAVGEPDWDQLHAAIKNKYNADYAERIITERRWSWYYEKADWEKCGVYFEKSIQLKGLDTSNVMSVFVNNNVIFKLFQNLNSRPILENLFAIQKHLCNSYPDSPGILDTYANLAYKLGKTELAISSETRAWTLEQQEAKKGNIAPDQVYPQTIEKMQKGEPTWQNPNK